MTAHLPYGTVNPTSGHSGSDTSEERAERQDADGTTAARQAAVLRFLNEREERGATWQEVALRLGLHHGAASGVLSNLHRVEEISRLTERRSRCKVYVLPQYVNGRGTERQGRSAENTLLDDMAALIKRQRDTGLVPSEHQMNTLLERYNRSLR